MMVGSKRQFAVEFELNPPPSPTATSAEHLAYKRFLPGKMCFWVGGRGVGDFAQGGSLSVALHDVALLLRFAGRREDARLLELDTNTLFHEIDGALYGDDDGLTEEALAKKWEEFGPFTAWPAGFDVFDGWKAYIVEGKRYARYLHRDRDGPIVETRLSPGEFDRVLDRFVSELRDFIPK